LGGRFPPVEESIQEGKGLEGKKVIGHFPITGEEKLAIEDSDRKLPRRKVEHKERKGKKKGSSAS